MCPLEQRSRLEIRRFQIQHASSTVFFFSLSLVRYHSPSICLEIDLWSSIIIQIVFHMNPYDPFLTQQKARICHSGLGILISLNKQAPFSGASRWFSVDLYRLFLGWMNSSEVFSPNAHPPAPGNDRLYKGIMMFFPPSSPNKAGCFPGGKRGIGKVRPLGISHVKKAHKQTNF